MKLLMVGFPDEFELLDAAEDMLIIVYLVDKVNEKVAGCCLFNGWISVAKVLTITLDFG